METGLRQGYLGTARRKGRQQTNQTYCYRATSLLYRPRAIGLFLLKVGNVLNTSQSPARIQACPGVSSGFVTPDTACFAAYFTCTLL